MSWLSERVRALDLLIRGSSAFTVIALAAVLVSSAFTITSGVLRARDYLKGTVGWRGVETEKLNKLVAGTNIGAFVAVLGPALFIRESSEPVTGYFGSRGQMSEKVVESTFRGHGYWVQAIHDSAGTVLVMAVTSCDATFQPTFNRSGPQIKLYRTTFADLSPQANLKKRYFLSGATANTYFYEEAASTNPTNYQVVAWGVNDACPYSLDRASIGALIGFRSDQPLSAGVLEFRKKMVVNTYVETAALIWETDPLWNAFHYGADRILLRTVPK